jgi:polar amino acid transport system substrate-binding protein
MYDNMYFAAFIPVWANRLWIRVLGWFLLAFACVAFIFKACGGSSEYRPDYYTVARDTTWHPFPIGRHASDMVAFTDELLAATAADNNIRIRTYDTTSTSLLFGLNNGQWDGVLSALEPNGYNSRQYSFSQPFYSTGVVLIVAANSPVRTINDLKGKIVGILPSVVLDTSIARQQAIFTPYSSEWRGLEDLLSNRVDALVMNDAKARAYTRAQYKDTMRIIPSNLTDAALRLVVRKNHQPGLELIKYFDNTLQQQQADGKYNDMLMKWRLLID